MKLVPLHDELYLLERLKEGDHAAFEQIYHLYKSRMIANALRLLKSRELAEELLQNLFLKVWEQRGRIDTTQPLNAFLYKIAQNMSYDFFRKISRDKKLHEHLIAATVSSYEHIEKQIFSKENQAALNKAISLLSPQQQKVFTLCKLEEKSYEEAGRILNITPGTINNHMHRANLFLKEYFLRQSRSGVAVALIASVICRDL
ncbi:sigma-70 family RNA polymerase sigma factor [Flavobacterium zepuense]|uniref:Sigma-70 family RNA polymerase sigma factor n=1 Tax=Flavobacterium zepuense TaxID=2593302 RepID=A0A552UUN7_9FLAO|nr:sigma-70 family RNA polymerase sigma factor [Flavobacterium zepuense]TRW21944.1 sigma-70 family RNA polymerase sigma factor [Flavobacterium zepuense]